MNSLGETLRRERVRQGLDLQQVSERTKIGTRMLQAMESGDFSKLPGGVFTRSFVKQYAVVLGIDPATLEQDLRDFRAEGEETPRASSRKRFEPDVSGPSIYSTTPRGNPLLSSGLWVLLALGVCGAIYYFTSRPGSQAPRQAASPSPAQKSPSPQTAPAASPVQEATTKAPEAPPNIAAAAPVTVVLSASEPSWVSVSADGKHSFIATLRADDKREISADETVRVVTGNAGGLEISINGKTIEPIGPRGQVRTVDLTATGAHVVSRTPPNPSPLF